MSFRPLPAHAHALAALFFAGAAGCTAVPDDDDSSPGDSGMPASSGTAPGSGSSSVGAATSKEFLPSSTSASGPAPSSSAAAIPDAGMAADGSVPASSSGEFPLSSSAQSSSSSAAEPSSSSWSGEPPPAFTLVVMPDTQYYSLDFPDVFAAQTQWIRDHATQRRVAYVLHEGDLTQSNTPQEWNVANDAMSRLDGAVPWAFVLGNHDHSLNGFATDRTTLAETVFPVSRFQDWPTFGDVFEPGSMASSYHLFTAGGRDYLALMLEFGPRDEVLEWANALCGYYSGRAVIVVTHSFVNENDERCGAGCDYNPHWYGMGTTINDGEETWQKFVRRHANIRLVLNGHHLGDGLGRVISAGDHGNFVAQVLANYQVRPIGGEGYLRLLEFSDDGMAVRVRSFSPWVESFDPVRAWLTGPEDDFTIDLARGEFVLP